MLDYRLGAAAPIVPEPEFSLPLRKGNAFAPSGSPAAPASGAWAALAQEARAAVDGVFWHGEDPHPPHTPRLWFGWILRGGKNPPVIWQLRPDEQGLVDARYAYSVRTGTEYQPTEGYDPHRWA